MHIVRTLIALLLASVLFARGERINHAGRILGNLPVVTNSVLFNTNQSDAIVAAMQIMPRDNPWNEDISRRPLLTNSDVMISQISSELLSSRRSLRAFSEMNFVLVPDAQPLVPITFMDYADESDPSPYPIPSNLPIESWPVGTPIGMTLNEWQEDTNNVGGDRHSITVQPGTGFFWETWQAKRVGTNWEASNGARFNLNSNSLRPAMWTSGDAAGLPMFPGIVRYDECARGVVEHALRVIVKHTRAEFIYPARHYASVPWTNSPNFPAMGERLRLKASFVVPSSWSKEEKAICAALQKYGAIMADNGNFFSISVAPDDRFSGSAFSHLGSGGILSITNFEVIQTTGPAEGPRSPGAPVVDAGPDLTTPAGIPVALQGLVRYTNAAPLVVHWKYYSGPTNVSFADATRTNTTVSFGTPGLYTLMLSADDSIHTAAYDAVVIQVTDAITTRIVRAGNNLMVAWTGGKGPYELQKAASVSATSWVVVATTSGTNWALPNASGPAFYRVKGQ